MQRILSTFVIFISILTSVFAQEAKPTYFEKTSNDMLRFYYDTDYYLVDKNCEFKFLERVAAFNVSNNRFNGEFKDFDPNGRVILSGTYVQGSKEGEFNSFYPDGTQKWKATFKNNQPFGEFHFFYPDGKPMLFLTYYNQNIFINQFWDRLGKQKVKDGEGSLEITLPIKGFTEHGFTKYVTKGSVKGGAQQGLWYTSFVTENNRRKETSFMVSSYENGVLRDRETDEFFDGMLIDHNSFSFVPDEFFPNGELLQSKNCTFDEHSGFNSFIAEKFKDFSRKAKYKPLNDGKTNITYSIRVSKDGVPFSPTLTETSRELPQKERIFFGHMINQIPYYLPSYLDGKPISDKLSISFTIEANGDNITIEPVQIKREKGF